MTLVLSTIDNEALSAIYRFRCLTPKQVYERFYGNMYETYYDFIANKLADKWIPLGLVTLEKSQQQHVLFLTNAGIAQVIDYLALPTEVVERGGKITKGYRTAAMLHLNEKLFNHQIHLNDFVFDLLNWLEANHPNLPVHYEDEKHISHYSFIRPDGLLRLLDVDIFLEMDMGTESKAQLEKKWEKYRQFLNSTRVEGLERGLIVFFICDGKVNLANRKALVRKTLFEQISGLMTSEIDFYVGTKDELMTLFQTALLPDWLTPHTRTLDWQPYLQEQGLTISRMTAKSELFERIQHASYQYYVRDLNEQGQTRIVRGHYAEWFFDDYRQKPMSILSVLSFHESNNHQFKHHVQRRFKYVVLVEDEVELIQELYQYNLWGLQDVFFTTLKRLQQSPFAEALFSIAADGRVFSYESLGGKQIYEGELEEDELEWAIDEDA